MYLTRSMLGRAFRWMMVSLGTAAALTAGAAAQELPRLEINSPFAGTPLSLDGDSSGSYLVTTSSARTLTIWTRTGEKSWQPAIIHAPRHDEFASASYLGAMTPDGKYVAFGVPPLSDGSGSYQANTALIYILDRTDEHLVTTLSAGIPTKMMRLRFSPDGQYLGAILGNGCGYRIWTREQWTSPASAQAPKWADDQAYADESGATKCSDNPSADDSDSLPSGTDIVFTGHSEPDAPWLLTLTDNGFRSYVKTGDEIVRTGYLSSQALSVARPHGMALTDDIGGIAIGDYDAPNLAVLRRDGVKYAFSKSLPVPDSQLSTVGKDSVAQGALFLPNPIWVTKQGRTFLYAFGYFQPSNLAGNDPNDNANSIVVLDPETDNARLIKLQDDSDSSLGALHAGNNIFFVSTRRLSVLDVKSDVDAVTPIANSHGLDLRGRLPIFGLPLSKKGKLLYLPTVTGDDKFLAFRFDYGSMNFEAVQNLAGAANLESSVAGYNQSPDYYDTVPSPQEWGFDRLVVNPPVPTFFGHPISTENIDRNEVSHSAAPIPGGKQLVWGTDRMLRLVNSDATFDCVRPIESTAWRMNITNDGRMVIVAHGDGVMRWYRLKANADRCLPLVASLYVTRDDEGNLGFLAWLPNGKFMTGGGAGSKSIACYPTPKPNALTSCVDFQQTGLYDRDAVIRALSEASTDEGAPPDARVQQTLTKAASEDNMSVRLYGENDGQTSVSQYSVTATVSGWKEGTRYLRLSAGAGVDVPFSHNGIPYGADRPMPLSTPGDFNLTLTVPEVLHHKATPIRLCPAVDKAG